MLNNFTNNLFKLYSIIWHPRIKVINIQNNIKNIGHDSRRKMKLIMVIQHQSIDINIKADSEKPAWVS